MKNYMVNNDDDDEIHIAFLEVSDPMKFEEIICCKSWQRTVKHKIEAIEKSDIKHFDTL